MTILMIYETVCTHMFGPTVDDVLYQLSHETPPNTGIRYIVSASGTPVVLLAKRPIYSVSREQLTSEDYAHAEKILNEAKRTSGAHYSIELEVA